jgi:hypothetical protein
VMSEKSRLKPWSALEMPSATRLDHHWMDKV